MTSAALPLFDDDDGGAIPDARPPPVDTGTYDPALWQIGAPAYMAYWTGSKHGYSGHAATFRFSPDPRVNQAYVDGHRLGALFRPRPNPTKSDPRKLRRR